jgi:hypothetical protein
MRNADITWDGTPFGLMATVDGAASKELLALGAGARPALILALDDPERYAAAHVLLTHLEMYEGKSIDNSAAEWNHLRVNLLANGTIQLYPEQRAELKAFWLKSLKRGA